MNQRTLNQSGQSTLAMAAVISAVVLGGGLFALQYSGQTAASRVKSSKNVELSAALQAGAQKAQELFQSSSCDPGILNGKFNRMMPDGTLRATLSADPSLATDATFPSRRQFITVVGTQKYPVNFGRISIVTNPTPPADGTSQDTVVQMWTQFAGQRVEQSVVLMNNCSYPGQGTGSQTPETVYHRIATVTDGHYTCSIPGNIVRNDANPSEVNINDLVALRNYIRTGQVPPGVTTTGPNNINVCGDLNLDGVVNEADLAILEKYLRGYITRIPVRPPACALGASPTC